MQITAGSNERLFRRNVNVGSQKQKSRGVVDHPGFREKFV
jgi:hypothetical protein